MIDEIIVQLEFTPNPDTLKYSTNKTLLLSGAANFTSKEAAVDKSPLAEKLFEIPQISAVMIGTNFATVTLRNQDGLQQLSDQISNVVKNFLATGAQAVIPQAKTNSSSLSEIENKIVSILDAEIRPAVAMDGGDISFEKYEDGFVYLRMQGSCAGCPSSMMTLKMGVETRLKEAIPEIQEVIPV